MKIKWFELISAIIICNLAGFIGSFATSSSVSTWYQTLNKPFFNPPNWVFAPVWTTLFILMGIALYLIWIKGFKKKEVKEAVSIFGIQLGFNILWSYLFFGLRNPLLAFIEIMILWLAILFMIIYFYKVNKTAAYMQIPYILWVSFAAMLNLSIVLLN